jgi:hypothetical protein
LVLVRLHPQSSRPHQRSAKLNFRWSVPLVISKFVSPVTAVLANPDTRVIVRKADVCELKVPPSSCFVNVVKRPRTVCFSAKGDIQPCCT